MNLVWDVHYSADKDVRMSQNPEFVFQGDTLRISCAVNYSGILEPEFHWFPTPDSILPLINTDSSVNASLEVDVTSAAVQLYTCYVTFDGLILPFADNRTSNPVNASGKHNHFLRARASIAIATVILSVCPSRPGTNPRPGEIETSVLTV